jgi:hypothetical protein
MWSELSHLLAANTLHHFLSYWGTNFGAAEGQTLNTKDGGLIVYFLLHLLTYSVFIWYELIQPTFCSYIGKDSIESSILTNMKCGFMFLPSLAIVMTVWKTLNSIYTERNTLIIQYNLWLFFKINMSCLYFHPNFVGMWLNKVIRYFTYNHNMLQDLTFDCIKYKI